MQGMNDNKVTRNIYIKNSQLWNKGLIYRTAKCHNVSTSFPAVQILFLKSVVLESKALIVLIIRVVLFIYIHTIDTSNTKGFIEH